jgi:hypothetical protein
LFSARGQTPDTGANEDTDMIAVLVVDDKFTILDRLSPRSDGKGDKAVNAPGVLLVHPVFSVEVLHFGSDASGVLARVHKRNGTYSGFTCEQALPEWFNSNTEGSHGTKAGHYHSA